MSEQHKSILRKGNAAIASGDNEGFLVFCTEDTKWTFVGDIELRGKEAVRQWMKDSYQVPPQVTVDNLIGEGNFLTAIGEVTVMEDNTQVTSWYCDVWEFRDGLIVGLRAFVVPKKQGR